MTIDGTGPLTTASGALAADSQDSGRSGAGDPCATAATTAHAGPAVSSLMSTTRSVGRCG
ncbi:hypothetical protein ACWCXK_01655 [Streptomyces sp. NPDC001739]|uniref:hypothetical protein n=1 Tax=unclassified Streptomyces TaxID=2593676 RepID=UPI0033284589